MASRTLQFFLLELSNSLRRNMVMFIASVSTVMVLIYLFGFFLLFFISFQRFKSSLASQIEIHAYLKQDIQENEAYRMKHILALTPHVVSVIYVPREEAFNRLKQDLKQDIDLSGILNNPLPPYLSIHVDEPENMDSVAEKVKKIRQVAEVNYLQKTAKQFAALLKITERFFLGLVSFLLICALLIIHNTIRLGVFSRKKEIEIMQLVGASYGFIRWPFILEGAFYGFLGAFLAILFLQPSYQALTLKLSEILPLLPLAKTKEVWQSFVWLLLLGVLVGGSGSLFSVNRYLRY